MASPAQQKKSFVGLIDVVDNVPDSFDFKSLYRLLLPQDSRPHGFMIPSTVLRMPWTRDFTIDHTACTVQVLDSSNGASTSKAVNAAFQAVIDAAIDRDIFPTLHGTHSEKYRIIGARKYHRSPGHTTDDDDDSIISLERFAAPLFGIATRGAHLTAYTRSPSGVLKIWIARRSPQLFAYPNLLDTSVAGGVKATHSPLTCIVEESYEEASLAKDFVRSHAKPTGAITYCSKSASTGLFSSNVLFVYDIEVPEDMPLTPNDDEVAEFRVMGVQEVVERMLNEEFKPNCVLVMLDFLIRQGELDEGNLKEYLDIVVRLRRRLPVPLSPDS